jgi:hypothetical protein
LILFLLHYKELSLSLVLVKKRIFRVKRIFLEMNNQGKEIFPVIEQGKPIEVERAT